MSTVSAIVPQPITTAKLISSTAPEADYPVWDKAKTYAVGDRCIVLDTHRIYECSRASNTGKDPTDVRNRTGASATDAPWWFDFGPTNRWAMFDGDVSTQTVVPTSLTVVLRPGLFNSAYLAGIDADNALIVVRDKAGGDVVDTRNVRLEESAPADYDEYFWMPYRPQTDLLITGIEQYAKAEISVTLSKGGGDVKCSFMAVGDMRVVGRTLTGVKIKPRSFSYVDLDKYGRLTTVRRPATVDMSLTALVDPVEADRVIDMSKDLLDMVAVWIGSELPGYRSLRVVGRADSSMEYTGMQRRYSLDVTGVISTASQ